MNPQTKPALRSGASLLAVVLLSLLAAGVARAADSIYWVNGIGKISHANLAGGGAGDIPIAGGLDEPTGLAIDSAAGKVYWANFGDNTVFVANLDGSGGNQLNTAGAPVDEPVGLAIDPLAGKIYWANRGNGTIGVANLNGSGGAPLNTAGAALNEPVGVAIDPATGRIYWANAGLGTIAFASLDGSGKGGKLEVAAGLVDVPEGVAVDTAANRIYWANDGNNTIASAHLDGSDGAQLPTAGASVIEPTGLAIDHAAGRIYWANFAGNTIASANLDGGGGAPLSTTGATTDFPLMPVLLKSPLGVQPPIASIVRSPVARASSGTAGPGANLSCSQGTWAPDLLESFLYRAPQSFAYRWLRNGVPIAGATSSSFKTSLVGKYSCQETATNFAGSASQTSAPVTIAATIKVGKARLNLRRGTAMLPVTVTGSGRLSLTGRGIVAQRRSRASGTVRLALRAKGRSKRALIAKGKVKLRALIAFTPSGGRALRVTRPITLKLR